MRQMVIAAVICFACCSALATPTTLPTSRPSPTSQPVSSIPKIMRELRERIAELEKQVATMQKENDKLRDELAQFKHATQDGEIKLGMTIDEVTAVLKDGGKYDTMPVKVSDGAEELTVYRWIVYPVRVRGTTIRVYGSFNRNGRLVRYEK